MEVREVVVEVVVGTVLEPDLHPVREITVLMAGITPVPVFRDVASLREVVLPQNIIPDLLFEGSAELVY